MDELPPLSEVFRLYHTIYTNLLMMGYSKKDALDAVAEVMTEGFGRAE
jgi:hypothetical protein